MIVKKSGGRVFGAALTAAERKAMSIEINKQIAENDRKHAIEVDALILWELRVQLGLGPVRLKRFYEGFTQKYEELLKRYELGKDDMPWLMTEQLKRDGIDVEQWYEESLKKSDL